jgi:hypothetical protein
MEFYQLLTYTNDVDLNKRLDEWGKWASLMAVFGDRFLMGSLEAN